MIKKIVHFSDLHLRLFKDHDLYKRIIVDMLNKFKDIEPDRIVFTGDLVHSKNQMTPELIEFVAWVLTECSKIAKTIVIIGNHDFLENNMSRLDALTPIIESLKNEKGEDISTKEIKKILETVIEEEDKRKPLTDETLAAILKDKGYPIARRTVAKYREQLEVPVARLRKKM